MACSTAAAASWWSPNSRYSGLPTGSCSGTLRERRQVPVPEGIPRLFVPSRTRKEMPHERSEEHTSELQSLMRISYAVFCLKKKETNNMYTAEVMILPIHSKTRNTQNTINTKLPSIKDICIN